MTINELRTELEKVISGLRASDFKSIDSGTVEKLNTFSAAASELDMKEGKHLIENLTGVLKAIQEGKSQAESGNVRLTALEFYMKKLADSGNTEEL